MMLAGLTLIACSSPLDTELKDVPDNFQLPCLVAACERMHAGELFGDEFNMLHVLLAAVFETDRERLEEHLKTACRDSEIVVA